MISSSIREEVDTLKYRFTRFKEQFDRGVNVQSAMAIESISKKVEKSG
jgi:hypothetical protein